MEILEFLGIKDDWQLILTLSVFLTHARVMWQRTKVANENLSKFGKLADILLANDPSAKMPNTPYVVSLIDKFHLMFEQVGDLEEKLDRVLERLNVQAPAARRRIERDG